MTINNTINKLYDCKLHGMREAFEQQLNISTYTALPFEERFATLVDAEILWRTNAKRVRLLKVAKLREKANPEDIEYHPNRNIDQSVIAKLLTCQWINKAENILLTGSTGAGKTWLACALGMQAIRQGLPVSYMRVTHLFEEMQRARTENRIERLRLKYSKFKLLILDDFGLIKMKPQERSDLFEILENRMGNVSTIVAGQLPVSSWHAFIGDIAIADAILDRLTNSSHRIELKGKSQRKPLT